MSNQTTKSQQNPGASSAPEKIKPGVDESVRPQGTRQYEGGKNPNMQVQGSDRQGDGNPTQQRRSDR